MRQLLSICLNIFLTFAIGILSFVSKLFIDGICVEALAPTSRTVSGATFHPLVVMEILRGRHRSRLISNGVSRVWMIGGRGGDVSLILLYCSLLGCPLVCDLAEYCGDLWSVGNDIHFVAMFFWSNGCVSMVYASHWPKWIIKPGNTIWYNYVFYSTSIEYGENHFFIYYTKYCIWYHLLFGVAQCYIFFILNINWPSKDVDVL